MSRRYVGILGFPLGHTLSPVFQQAALDYLGLDVLYKVWETPSDALASKVASLRAKDMLGANVTIPHKEAVMPLMDDIDAAAQRIRAVNTIVNQEGSLKGYNTDYYGFLKGLEQAGCEPHGCEVLLLGAGGAARAVACALLDNNIRSLTIVNRGQSRAEALYSGLIGIYPSDKITVRPWDQDAIKGSLAVSHLVVNCTSIGMKGEAESLSPLDDIAIPQETVIYDLVYNPPETALLRQAVDAGAKTIPGLPMLIHQGAAAFELWIGQKAPVDAMMNAATEALTR